ncbi:hypothetical protein [Mameliella alba]|uniref:hypothetical protein n=1 Tax=Mameliella alba TaxID=561184 RepID=UPI000B529CE9|nr:hypothetical protein [Mameliella alba]MBY6122073.1 hypothetical protein [Mameliella alba]OWV39892.1 hypothetical protein CDZ95_23755 [Mameliella alba]OWV56281.1 hypothetical protein CDZ97_22515 [Mameliella alba]
MRPIRRPLACLVLLGVALAQPVFAQAPLSAQMDDVERLEQALEDRIGPDAALDVMAGALSATEVTEGHVQAWANGLTAVYFRFDDLYEDAGIALRAWRRAVWDDRYTEREARQHVDAGLHDLRLAHDEIVASLPDYLFHVARSQTWSDRARRIARTTSIAGEGCRPYYRALNMADMERSRARASLPYHLLDRSLLPLPEEEPRGDDLLRIFAAVLPRDPVPPAVLRRRYDRLLSELESAGLPAEDPLVFSVRMAAAQTGQWQTTLPVLVGGLGKVDGQARDRIAAETAGILATRISELLPLLALIEPGEGGLDRAHDLVDVAQRLVLLHDDLERRGVDASPLLRGLSAVRSALLVLRTPGSGEEARRLNAAIADLGRFASRDIPPTAPIAVPAAIAAGVIDVAGEGFDQSAQTLDHLARYLETGDPADYQRILEAARGVQDVLSPRNFLRHAVVGGIEGVVSNVPGLRSFLGRHIEELAEWALDSEPYDWEASYDPGLLGPRGQGVCPRS